LVVDGTLSELVRAGRVTEALFAALHPSVGGVSTVLTLPDLAEREADLPILVHHFAQTAAAEEEKTIADIHPGIPALLGQVSGIRSAAQLAQVTAAAVRACDGTELVPSHLPLELPDRYQVSYNDGSGPQARTVSDRELWEFIDPERFDLVLFLRRDGDGELATEGLFSKGEPATLTDPRLAKLLTLLLQNAGNRVDLGAAKHRLGISPAEPIKRHLYELRRALNDPVIEKTRSHYFTGHWGEACTFHAGVPFSLVVETSQR